MKKWRTIKTFPRNGDEFLVSARLADDEWIYGVGRWNGLLGEVVEKGTLAVGWTHWMPLPEPPESEK